MPGCFHGLPRSVARATSGDPSHSVNQSLDFAGRVAGAAGADQPVASSPVARRPWPRKVSIRNKERPFGQAPSYVSRRNARDREGDRRRPRLARRRTEKIYALDLTQTIPKLPNEFIAALAISKSGIQRCAPCLPRRNEARKSTAAAAPRFLRDSGCRFRPFRRVVRRAPVSEIERREEIMSSIKDSDVRPIEFIGRAAKEITVHLAHVHQLVRRNAPVDENFRPRREPFPLRGRR